MQALVKKEAKPGLWLVNVPVPSYGAQDVLIRIKKTAICGTDLHIYEWDKWSQDRVPVPLIIGHEFVGEVAAMGADVRGFAIGERVSGEGHLTCGQCRNCRAGKRHLCRKTRGIGYDVPGAFAEYLALPASNVFKVSSAISDDLAAIFDPLGNAVHTALSFDLVGEDVLITGAGPIGIMATAIARHVGARHIVITDVNDYRLKLAEKMGATRIVNANTTNLKEVMADLHMSEGFDVGLEMSGQAKALNDMLGVMNNGGKVALLGIYPDKVAINWSEVIFKELTLKGIYGREMFETWYKMASMLESGLNISPVITHQFPMGQFQEGFSMIKNGNAGKIILDWAS